MKRWALLVAIAACVTKSSSAAQAPQFVGDRDVLLQSPAETAVASSNDSGADEADATKGKPQYRWASTCGCDDGCQDDWRAHEALACGTRCTSDSGQTLGGGMLLGDDAIWAYDDVCRDVRGPGLVAWSDAVRLGWWGVATDGSKNKTGEYQDLESSPFWDLNMISSDGVRTWDVALTGLDNEANDALARYYGPRGAAEIDFQRYLRRLDHDQLAGFDLTGPVLPTADDNVVTEDLNVGEDYAIRINELDAKFRGKLSNNLKWRLNLWGQRKFGERQSSAVAHCFSVGGDAGNTCHLVSQRQTIDWLTMEIEPALEARFENVSVEYSRTMRSFSQDDGTASRQYMRFGFSPANGVLGPDYNYAVVPESFTQIDRLKISAWLTETNQLYSYFYLGDTKNQHRDMHREFNGFDVRWINSSIEDVKLTAYARRHEENNEFPPFFLNQPPLAPADTYDQDSVRHPVDYVRMRAGLKGSWLPFGDRTSRWASYGLRDGTSLAAGYEYFQLERDFATWDVNPTPFTQPDTISHEIELGPSTRWSRSFDTYARYKVRFIEDPLIGVSERAADEPDVRGTFNTNQPEQQHVVEIGGTWTPAVNFMTTAQLSVVNSWHDSEFANFTEDNYPMVFTAWYAPTRRLSLTGAYAYFSNWIDQDVTLGANRGDPTEVETTSWNYGGESQLVNFGANYALNPRVQLVGGYEWNRGTNSFSVPPSPVGADWSLLPFLSDVIVETNRFTTGVDWQPYYDTDLYFRYVFFDYADLSAGLTSGTAHMVLAGATRTW